MEQMKLMYDARTRRWFERNPFVETTVVQCEVCSLAYRPSLGHKCKQKAEGRINGGTTDSETKRW